MRILIADDNQLIRRGIAGLLAQQEGWEVCGEASDSAGAIEKASELHPDLILLDVSMPGGKGFRNDRIESDVPYLNMKVEINAVAL